MEETTISEFESADKECVDLTYLQAKSKNVNFTIIMNIVNIQHCEQPSYIFVSDMKNIYAPCNIDIPFTFSWLNLIFFVNLYFLLHFFIYAQLYLFKAMLHLQDRMYVHIRSSTSSQIILWATHQDLVTNMPCVNLVTLLHINIFNIYVSTH